MLELDTEACLVSDFWTVMEKTGSDFTNTFRDLAQVTKSPNMSPQDEVALAKLQSHCAPKEHFIAKCKS